ncbi:MAG: 4Fe-4S binding protein [Clostridia bacterium]|nr:4Fe-4S binding protein [Clostridia bacterium]
MRNKIIGCAKRYDADIIGFAPASRFGKDDPIFKIFPETKTVIGMGFRVLRGIYRGVEEGTTYYQYTTMGVENLEETVMPLALINVANLVEEEGFEAIPQRKNPLILNEEGTTNPEVDYTDVAHGVKAENQIDFLNCAVQCGLGERSMIGSLLTKDYGPFIRYCFILTDAEIEPTPLFAEKLCDGCGECIKACPGGAISAEGALDTWRCAVYYNGANGTKNPFMPPEAFAEFANRMEIINGTAEFGVEQAKEILDNIYFYPPAKHFYRTSICGRACDRACYIHLEEKGVLGKSFNKKFRNGEDWKLSTTQFVTGKREKEWEFSCNKGEEK